MSELVYQVKGGKECKKFFVLLVKVIHFTDPEAKGIPAHTPALAINRGSTLEVVFLEAWHLMIYGSFQSSKNALKDPYIQSFYLYTLLSQKYIKFHTIN